MQPFKTLHILIMQSDYFHSLSKEPVISSLSVFEGLDSNGGRSVEVDLYCTVCGMDKVRVQVGM